MSLTGQMLRLHQAIYERTDGRLGHRTIGVPTLLLRTTGRRSGATRTNGLVYARDGDAYLVVASNGGADREPGHDACDQQPVARWARVLWRQQRESFRRVGPPSASPGRLSSH